MEGGFEEVDERAASTAQQLREYFRAERRTVFSSSEIITAIIIDVWGGTTEDAKDEGNRKTARGLFDLLTAGFIEHVEQGADVFRFVN